MENKAWIVLIRRASLVEMFSRHGKGVLFATQSEAMTVAKTVGCQYEILCVDVPDEKKMSKSPSGRKHRPRRQCSYYG